MNAEKIEQIRKKMHAEICREWQETAADEVRNGTPPSRILTRIAAAYGMTTQGVVKILTTAGVYAGAREFRKTVLEEAAAAELKEQQP
jgi:hypothetical protein